MELGVDNPSNFHETLIREYTAYAAIFVKQRRVVGGCIL